jgi:hypothetical protein
MKRKIRLRSVHEAGEITILVIRETADRWEGRSESAPALGPPRWWPPPPNFYVYRKTNWKEVE